MRDHQPNEIETFNGLWMRGRVESCPKDHFSNATNVKYTQNGVEVRDGFASHITIGSAIRMYVYKIFGQADRKLILDNSGNIWDSTNLITPILTIGGMTDFAYVNFNSRAYISPSDGITGLAGEKVYVYNGAGVAVPAAGVAPTGSGFNATDSGSSGSVEAGFHILAVVFETATGFITAPGPALFAGINAIGGQGITLHNIPTGPSNTVARRIIATKIIPVFTGDQTGYQFFFVPGGRIVDNTTTTATVNFFDAQLLSDASYTFDLFATIPAFVGMGVYRGRLVGWGENANPSVVRISQVGQPEAINQINGLLVVDPSSTVSGITVCQEYRDILYIFKYDHAYAASDNGGDPTTWNVVVLEEGIGAFLHGVIPVFDSGGINIDRLFILSPTGVICFDGTFNYPETSYKIRDLWARITLQYASKIQACQDAIAQLIYIAVPVDGAISPSIIIVMDYSNTSVNTVLPDFHMKIKWAYWILPVACSTIVCEIEVVTSGQIGAHLCVGSTNGNVYRQSIGRTDDFGNTIPTPLIQTGLIGDDNIQHYGGVRLRVTGSGTLTTKLIGQDTVRSVTLATLTMAASPGGEPLLLANFISQRALVQISTATGIFKLNRIIAYTKQVYTMLPQ